MSSSPRFAAAALVLWVLGTGAYADPAADGLEFENVGRDCIALAVFTEARGEPEAGQRAVVEVIRARMESARWGSDPCEVVAELDQFHGYRDWPRPRHPRDVDAAAWERSLQVTDDVMLYGASSGCGPADHFWRGRWPEWASDYRAACLIGNHQFALAEH